MPARFKARSGVSKKYAIRGCASAASNPMLWYVARWLTRGTDTFSSMLFALCCELEELDDFLARKAALPVPFYRTFAVFAGLRESLRLSWWVMVCIP